MSALALALAAAAPAGVPPALWDAMPVFPLPRATLAEDGAAAFVRSEVDAGRCAAAIRATDGTRLAASVAILVGPSGLVRQVVPRAIDCPTVEQYTVGYVLSLTRGGPGSAPAPDAGWYKLTVTYRW